MSRMCIRRIYTVITSRNSPAYKSRRKIIFRNFLDVTAPSFMRIVFRLCRRYNAPIPTAECRHPQNRQDIRRNPQSTAAISECALGYNAALPVNAEFHSRIPPRFESIPYSPYRIPPIFGSRNRPPAESHIAESNAIISLLCVRNGQPVARPIRAIRRFSDKCPKTHFPFAAAMQRLSVS